MKRKSLILIIFLIVCLMDAAAQAPQRSLELPIILKAEQQERVDDRAIASGNVEISWKEYKIYADYMEYNLKTKIITAEGRVTMVSKETAISGEKLQFNLNDRTGVLYDVQGQVPPSVSYKTDKLTQVDNDTLTFDKIKFTSCTQLVPRWRLSCSKGKIKKEKYIAMNNVLFKIKKIPVFYVPYLRYPLTDSGRATGFLFPGIGRSNLRGFFLFNSFYWNIKPNVDLTLGLDYYGKAGIGVYEELRYLFKFMDGNIKFYFFKYKPSVVLAEGESAPDNNSFYSSNSSDYFLEMNHKQHINLLNTKILVSIDKQSDANFLRLFSNDFDAVLRRISRSSVSINSNFANNIKFSVNAAIHDTFYTFNNSSRSLRYLPRISFNWNQQKIWILPGRFSLDTSFSRIQRVGKSYDEDEGLFVTDISSQRINIQPTYSLSMLKTSWLSIKADISSKHSFYAKSRDPKISITKPEAILDEPLHLGYNTAKVEMKGPIFSRIFEFKNSKLKHLIEPKITMRYVTQVDPEDRAKLIPVDNFDYPSYSFVGFSLTNRLLTKGKTASSAREVLSYIVSQDYYFDPELAHRGRKIKGIFPEFSELKNTLRFRPFKHLSLDAQLIYNHFLESEKFLNNFTRIRVNLSYTNRKSFLWGNFSYTRYVNPYLTKGHVFNRDVIGGKLNLDIPGFPIKLDSNINYDITAKEFRYGSTKIIFDYQCIKFIGELRMFRYGGRIETQFNAGITFGNLGMVKDFLGIED
jgi:lipopolysaccharide assembly outer membrane protein LptD (OstA)